jgi:hypothetical protein
MPAAAATVRLEARIRVDLHAAHKCAVELQGCTIGFKK